MGRTTENNFTKIVSKQSTSDRIMEIMKALPGGDCGGHGGCQCIDCKTCAAAIVEGAYIGLCPACSTEGINVIAEIMGVTPVEAKDQVAFIRCAGEAAGKNRFAGGLSCDDAVKKSFLDGECKYGCVGVGSCIERCKFDAMSLLEGMVIIDKARCNGCGACLGICPQELIVMVPGDATNFIPCASKDTEETTKEICGSGCIGCGDCEEACPESAIAMVDNCAVIDYEKCVGCVACALKCRKKIIVDEIHDLTKIKDKVTFVRCRGGNKANTKFTGLGAVSCKDAAKMRTQEMDLCQIGCVGLSDCVKVCRFDAIKVINGTAQVDPDKCVGCLDCVSACPNNLIVEVSYTGSKLVACASTYSCDEKLRVCGEGCIACGDCVSNCPNGAITIKDSFAVVDSSLCENCSICTYMCSRTALVEMVVSEANYLQRNALGI